MRKRILCACLLIVACWQGAAAQERESSVRYECRNQEGYLISIEAPVVEEGFGEGVADIRAKNRTFDFAHFQAVFSRYANRNGNATFDEPHTFTDEESAEWRQYWCTNRINNRYMVIPPIPGPGFPKNTLPEEDERVQMVRSVLDELEIEYEFPFYYAVAGIEDVRTGEIEGHNLRETDAFFIIRQTVEGIPLATGGVYFDSTSYAETLIYVAVDGEGDLIYLSTLNVVDAVAEGEKRPCISWEQAVETFMEKKTKLRGELAFCVPEGGRLEDGGLAVYAVLPELIFNVTAQRLIPVWEFNANLLLTWTDEEGNRHEDAFNARYFMDAFTGQPFWE